MKNLSFILILLAFTLNAFAHSAVLSSYQIPKLEKAILDQLAAKYELTNPSEKGFEVILPATEAKNLLSLVPQAKMIEADLQATVEKQLAHYAKTFQTGPKYRSFPEVEALLKDLEAKNPEIAKLEVYGKSRQGRNLMALKISQNVATDANKPEIMLTAATHGDELITTEVLLGLMDELLTGVKTKNPRFVNILNNYEIFFIPVVNPDGFANRNRYDGMQDPNRSYPYPESTNTPSPSIAGIIKFFHSHKIDASIDFHAFGEMVMYPWGYTENLISPAENLRFDPITTAMAKTNGYVHGPIATTIYVAKGSSCDYYYWKNNSLALAIEIGKQKVPAPAQIASSIKSQSESTWMFVENLK